MAMFGTALAVDPAGIAVDVILFFPYRQAYFYRIDDEPAGEERRIAMC